MTTAVAKIQGNQVKAHASCNSVGAATKEVESLSHSQDIPEGFCQCGCGGKTAVPKYNNAAKREVAGVPKPYVSGHRARKYSGPKYEERDRGYDTPCWIWLWGMDSHTGYGQYYGGGRSTHAHRWMYEKMVGPIPAGLHIDHLCRVRECCNPAHMEPVTNGENQRRGANTKLTAEKVAQIKRRALCGEFQGAIAADYGVARTTVSSVLRGASWRDIEPAAALGSGEGGKA